MKYAFKKCQDGVKRLGGQKNGTLSKKMGFMGFFLRWRTHPSFPQYGSLFLVQKYHLFGSFLSILSIRNWTIVYYIYSPKWLWELKILFFGSVPKLTRKTKRVNLRLKAYFWLLCVILISLVVK